MEQNVLENNGQNQDAKVVTTVSRRRFLRNILPFTATLLASCSLEIPETKPENDRLSSAWGQQDSTDSNDDTSGDTSETNAEEDDTVAHEVDTATIFLAVFGDYGTGGGASDSVADLVITQASSAMSQSEFRILAVGDHNYMDGNSFDLAIGRIYSRFMYPYNGKFGEGSPDQINRLSGPAGNHDWDAGIENFLAYFPAFNGKRYFSEKVGPIEVFHISSDTREPDGVEVGSKQANWLQSEMKTSKAIWKFVTMHHPPYSSGDHGSNEYMRWPFKDWGADIVFAGHDHNYERIEINGFTYITSGLGGAGAYPMRTKVEGSQFFHSPADKGNQIKDYGAVFLAVTPQKLEGKFLTVGGETVDTFILKK